MFTYVQLKFAPRYTLLLKKKRKGCRSFSILSTNFFECVHFYNKSIYLFIVAFCWSLTSTSPYQLDIEQEKQQSQTRDQPTEEEKMREKQQKTDTHTTTRIWTSKLIAKPERSDPGLQIRVLIVKLLSLFLNQSICYGYSKEPSQ